MIPLAGYLSAITPAFLLAASLLMLLPKALAMPRVIVHIFFFVLARDAMTGAGFWQLGAGSLRLTGDAATLLALAAMSCLLFAGTFWLEREARHGLRLVGRGIASAIVVGASGALLISLIVVCLKQVFSLPSLPAPDRNFLPVILIFAMAGNAYEELLFRGLFQNCLGRTLSPSRTVLVSGLFFCLCHSFLATNVTHVGAPVFAFTLIEGLVAAFVYQRAGLIGAAFTHGLAIFAVASGLV